jgi:hypothetical protein
MSRFMIIVLIQNYIPLAVESVVEGKKKPLLLAGKNIVIQEKRISQYHPPAITANPSYILRLTILKGLS